MRQEADMTDDIRRPWPVLIRYDDGSEDISSVNCTAQEYIDLRGDNPLLIVMREKPVLESPADVDDDVQWTEAMQRIAEGHTPCGACGKCPICVGCECS
jgi:hypothetical protein